jgi:Fe-S cluster assembly protein SufD
MTSPATNTATNQSSPPWVEHHYRVLRKQSATGEPDFLHSLRQQAFEHYQTLGFPTTRLEAWRETSLDPLVKIPFHWLPDGQEPPPLFDLNPFQIPNALRLAFVNGRYDPSLTAHTWLAPEVTIHSLKEILAENPDVLTDYLDQSTLYQQYALAALNTTFFTDGAFICVPAGFRLERPIHLFYVTPQNKENRVVYPRNIILMGAGSEAKIIEHHVGFPGVAYLNDAVTEIYLESDASLQHVKVIEEATGGSHLATTNVVQAQDSQFTSHVLSYGGDLVRNDLQVQLEGEGCACRLFGLVLAKAHEHVDNHTVVEHRYPQGTSEELYKGIYQDHARGVFNALVRVQPGAQKTDARQTNRNLLLSQTARVNSNPRLEINANDVQCTHASATGQMDPEVLFYLRSRGIDGFTAQTLFVHGFANDILETLPLGELRSRGERLLTQWMKTVSDGGSV